MLTTYPKRCRNPHVKLPVINRTKQVFPVHPRSFKNAIKSFWACSTCVASWPAATNLQIGHNWRGTRCTAAGTAGEGRDRGGKLWRHPRRPQGGQDAISSEATRGHKATGTHSMMWHIFLCQIRQGIRISHYFNVQMNAVLSTFSFSLGTLLKPTESASRRFFFPEILHGSLSAFRFSCSCFYALWFSCSDFNAPIIPFVEIIPLA